MRNLACGDQWILTVQIIHNQNAEHQGIISVASFHGLSIIHTCLLCPSSRWVSPCVLYRFLLMFIFWGVRKGGGGEQVSMVLVCWELMLFLLIFLLDFTQSTTNCTIIPYPKKIQKIYESRDKTFEFCWHQYFFAENQLILLYQEIGLLIHKDFFTPFDTSFLLISTFLESLRIVIINMDKVLMMSAKMPLFWGLVLVQVQ